MTSLKEVVVSGAFLDNYWLWLIIITFERRALRGGQWSLHINYVSCQPRPRTYICDEQP